MLHTLSPVAANAVEPEAIVILIDCGNETSAELYPLSRINFALED